MSGPGYVYFIEAVGAAAIKIGWALDPRRRLIQHAIGCPLELKLLCSAPGTLGHEGALQSRFSEVCIRGEWYSRNPALSALIEDVARTGQLPDDVSPSRGLIEIERPEMVPLLRCIEILGSQSAVARAIGTKPQNISAAVQKCARVPANWCLSLEAATITAGAPVWRDQLRPDIYPTADVRYLHPLRQQQLRSAA